jgi:hypothetical protein
MKKMNKCAAVGEILRGKILKCSNSYIADFVFCLKNTDPNQVRPFKRTAQKRVAGIFEIFLAKKKPNLLATRGKFFSSLQLI